jgi:hypothetical protein
VAVGIAAFDDRSTLLRGRRLPDPHRDQVAQGGEPLLACRVGATLGVLVREQSLLGSEEGIEGVASALGRAVRQTRARLGTALAIGPLRDLAAEALPTAQGHLDVDRIDLHRVGASSRALRSDQSGARAAEGLVQRLS